MDKEVRSSYVPLDIESAINEHGIVIREGETSRVAQLSNTFAWMRGFVNGWYGWSNDGKGTMLDFLMMLKSKHDKWKWCIYKQEDMDTAIVNGKPLIRANRIYKNLAWTLTGKTWSAGFAGKYKTPAMTFKEENEALEFVSNHFYVVYPEDRKFSCVMDNLKFMYEKFGVDGFLIDPWNTMKLPDDKRGDERLVDAFIDIKEFTMITNTVFNIINHPRSMNDVKDKDGKYKVVNQFMQLGGSAWDMKMDGQYSIYRPERHLNPADPKVHLYNLKQRQAEIVGVERGSYEKIIFDKIRKQYYFDGVNPMDGSVKDAKFTQSSFETSERKAPLSDDETPF